MNQIRYFVTVAKELHFTRAAQACNVTQPALTKAIQKLEEELGGELFLRERAHTQLTELGRLMLPALERALAAAVEAKQQAEAFRRRVTSPLRIGLELSVAAPLLTPSLSVVSRRCADIELSLHQDAQAEVCDRMMAGDLEVSVLVEGDSVNDRLHRWPLFCEQYLLACPPDHPFKDLESVPVSNLADECLLMVQNVNCPVRRSVKALCERSGVKPRREYFVTNQEQMVEMALASLGVFVSGERWPLPASLICRPITPDPGERTILIAVVAGRPLGPTAGLFLKLMRSRSWSSSDAPQAAAAA